MTAFWVTKKAGVCNWVQPVAPIDDTSGGRVQKARATSLTRSIQTARERARRTSETPRNIGSYKQKPREKSPRTRWFFKFSLSFHFVVHFHVDHGSWWLNRSDFSLIYHSYTLLFGLTSGWLSYQSMMSKPEQKSRDIKEVSATKQHSMINIINDWQFHITTGIDQSASSCPFCNYHNPRLIQSIYASPWHHINSLFNVIWPASWSFSDQSLSQYTCQSSNNCSSINTKDSSSATMWLSE